MCTKKEVQNSYIVTYDWDHIRSILAEFQTILKHSFTHTAVFECTWQHFETLYDFSPARLHRDSVITHQQGEHDESHKLTCVRLQQTKQTEQNRLHMSSKYNWFVLLLCIIDPQWHVVPETDQTFNYLLYLLNHPQYLPHTKQANYELEFLWNDLKMQLTTICSSSKKDTSAT